MISMERFIYQVHSLGGGLRGVAGGLSGPVPMGRTRNLQYCLDPMSSADIADSAYTSGDDKWEVEL